MVHKTLRTRFLSWAAYLLFIETALLIVILRLLSFSRAQPPRDGSVTCHVPSVAPMQNTSLTCHFPENVSETRKTVVIYFYKLENGQEQKDAKDVLECWWLAGKKTCLVQSGYKFNGMISHELTLEIPQASAKFTGKYACLISQINHHDINACEFRIQQEVRCDIPSVTSKSSATLTCYFPDYLNKTREDFVIYHHSDMITRCKQKAEVLNCHTGRGYVFDGEITDLVTLGIPSASDEHEGTYSCRIAGKKYENCSFALNKELPSSLNTSTANDTEHISLMCRLSVTVNGSSRRWNLSAVHVDVDGRIGMSDIGAINLTWKNGYYVRSLASGYEIKDLIITLPEDQGVENAVYPCSLILSSDMSKIEPTEPSADKVSDVYITVIVILIVLLVIVIGGFILYHWKCKQSCQAGKDGAIGTEEEKEGLLEDRQKDHIINISEDLPAGREGHRLLDEIKQMTGADVRLDLRSSTIRRRKRVRGSQHQIEAATNLIKQKIIAQETMSEQVQAFWLQWVEASFPDLDSRAYFLPPVYFNRVPMSRESVAGQNVLVLQSAPGQAGQSTRHATTPSTARVTCLPPPPCVQDSDVRADAAIQRLLFCLQKMFDKNREVLVGLSQLQFRQYMREPCYTAEAAQFPLPANLPPALPQNWKHGVFDVLLIHRHYGLVACQVHSFGDNIQALNMSQHDIDSIIRGKMRKVVTQLDKAEAMLSHLVSDIAPGLRITKTIAFPNLTAHQLQQAVSDDTQLTQDLCRYLGTSDPADITGLCLCCDQLSDPKTPCDVSSHVLWKLEHWWQRRVAGAGPDSHMTPAVYRTLVARFCGPATTVSVPCTCPPRVSVKTLGQAVWWTGECYTAVITLFPEQVQLLNKAPPRVFVAGPPGTGKTVVLLLMAIQWLRCGHHVYVVSTWWGSRTASIMLYHLLLQTVKTQQSAGVSPGQPHLLQYELDGGKQVKKAVNDLSQAASGGSLYVIADELGPENISDNFQTLCSKLLTQVPRLHLWAASCFHGYTPARWQVEYLTRPLRSPPVVVREVEQDEMISEYRDVLPYRGRGVSDHTDGPPVRRLYHGGQGHSVHWPGDCVTCGREVASFLHSLRDDALAQILTTSTLEGTTSPQLQWRDMLVLCWGQARANMDLVKGLREAGIPVRVEDDDIEDVATARSDVVWVADANRVRGLERKVVVCVELDPTFSILSSPARLLSMSRCTSQLAIVSLND